MKHHISQDGFDKLKSEWEDLKYNQQPEMKRQVQVAAAEGDRSENAAYTYGKMKLRDIDRRLKKLDFLIDNAIIVNQVETESGEIHFGASVTLKNLNTQKVFHYQIVGEAEADAVNNKISLASPIGKALLHKKAQEQVEVKTPRGLTPFEIQKVEY